MHLAATIKYPRNFQWLALSLTLIALLCEAHLSIADPTTRPSPRQAVPPQGVVILWGGGDVPKALAGQLGLRQPGDRPAKDRGWVNLPDVAPGTAVLDRVMVDAHFLDASPPPELLAKLTADPGLVGVGVSPGTALVIDGRSMQALGAGEVALCLPASVTRPADRPVKIQRIAKGGKADLIALSRAAIARLGPQFPPDIMPTPNVPTGTVMPCGGGTLPDSVLNRFIELAGGPGSPIVVMPIAQPDPETANPETIGALKRLGCTDLTVPRQRTHDQVESPAFAAAINRAHGIFFCGGRQWKYIDAYEGTIAPRLFAGVLARGGVIAGSSAGAAVLADYMVRGDPLGNTDISAEGYERGLCLLPGTAIDIHVTQRKRLAETKSLIKQFPQLLGLALDEATAAQVQGHIMTILGSGQAVVLDGHAGSSLELKAGDRFDLQARQKLKD
jgi:cyanophycinase